MRQLVAAICRRILGIGLYIINGPQYSSAIAPRAPVSYHLIASITDSYTVRGGSLAEWLACWTQAQKGLGSNRSRDAVG